MPVVARISVMKTLIWNVMNKTLVSLALPALLLASCGGSKKEDSVYPANFKSIGDAGRVDYMIKTATPDSVARFIIFGALGRNPGAPIDTLAIATNHAYEVLTGDAAETFAIEYDAVVEALPLGDKMKVYKLAGSEDPQGLGYKLGLEYMTSIRDGNKSVADVEKELQEFKKACAGDTAMYHRFLIGFRTVLKVDHGTDVPEDIYRKFVDYE